LKQLPPVVTVGNRATFLKEFYLTAEDYSYVVYDAMEEQSMILV